MNKNLVRLSGVIDFSDFAVGSKSEVRKPYLRTEGEKPVRLFLEGDNPFENSGLWVYNGKKVNLVGYAGRGGEIVVTEIQEDSTDEASDADSGEKCDSEDIETECDAEITEPIEEEN